MCVKCSGYKNMTKQEKSMICTQNLYWTLKSDAVHDFYLSDCFMLMLIVRLNTLLWYQLHNIMVNSLYMFQPPPPPGGVLRFGLDGSLRLEPQNPYPCLRVILTEKGTHFKGFFSKYIGPFFTIFGCSHGEHQNFGTHVYGFLIKKQPIRAANPRMS